MRIPFMHPDLADLSAFAAGELPAATHDRVATHLQGCPRCQDSLRFVHRVNEPALPSPSLSPDVLLARIQASRAAGERAILPVIANQIPRRVAMSRTWGVAAGLLVVLGVARALMPGDAMASGDEGVLTFTPSAPLAGSVVRVRYVPASNMFVGATSLRLRARVRTPMDESYTVPASHLRALGMLTRAGDGAFEGRFTIPDSVVFAVLAVESVDSAKVDDNVGTGWELLVAATDRRPAFAALVQRADDMMGRSWEEGYASVRRATELYPDSIRGWTYREFFERELFTGKSSDSIQALRSVTIRTLMDRAKQSPALGYVVMEAAYYRAYRAANRPGATRADSAEWDYWWQRMQREQPKHEQLVQRHAMWMDVRKIGLSVALDSLERLYHAFAPVRTPAGRNLVYTGLGVANELGNAATIRRWTERSLADTPDSARRIATFLSTKAEFREEGMSALRALLGDDRLAGMVPRGLGRNAAAQSASVADLRRAVLAALGRALVASGRSSEARDTLRMAAEGGWEPALFRDLARTYADAGDSAAMMVMRARLSVDSRTSEGQRDSLNREGEHRLGAPAWTTLVSDARREMHARIMERSVARAIAPTASVRSRDGERHALRELTGGRTALVIFWSRNCGYAIEALPRIAALVARLQAKGTPLVFVVDEAPSAELDAVLREKRITWPVYYDVRTVLGDAMRNFGTPHYYVVDGANRIRFADVEQLTDLYGRLDAVAAEAPRGAGER